MSIGAWKNLEGGFGSPGAGLPGPLQGQLLSPLSSTKGRWVFLVELSTGSFGMVGAGGGGRLGLRN